MKNLITPSDLRIGQQWIEDPSINNGVDYSFTILDIRDDEMEVKWRDVSDIHWYVTDRFLSTYVNDGEYTCIEPKSQNFNSLYEKLSA